MTFRLPGYLNCNDQCCTAQRGNLVPHCYSELLKKEINMDEELVEKTLYYFDVAVTHMKPVY